MAPMHNWDHSTAVTAVQANPNLNIGVTAVQCKAFQMLGRWGVGLRVDH